MYFLISIIMIVIILVGGIYSIKKMIGNENDKETVFCFLLAIFTAALFLSIFPAILLINHNPIKYNKQYNETNNKIILYTEENKIIDNEIKSIVESTYAKELKLYSSIKNKSTIELVTIFPNVKSIELVNKQLNIYMSNKTKINKLKEKKIEIESNKIYHQLW